MARKQLRTTVDRYLVQLKGVANRWRTLNTHETQEAANTELARYIAKEPHLKLRVVIKRVPNPDVHVVYYIMYKSSNGYTQVRAKATSVTDVETQLASYRTLFPMDADKFYVHKSVEMK